VGEAGGEEEGEEGEGAGERHSGVVMMGVVTTAVRRLSVKMSLTREMSPVAGVGPEAVAEAEAGGEGGVGLAVPQAQPAAVA
jgi:hypothetical protein